MPKKRKTKEERHREFLESMYEFGFSYNEERMAYRASHKADEMYTCYCGLPGEDHYCEEIDVLVEGLGDYPAAEAKRIAEQVIKWGFNPKLRVLEVVHRPRGIMFF